ncbi:MAG: hypothetical protein JXR49_12040 [Acidobacteria bacterium]|nr:hypothetical protein [Acidobacteriota bacterium]
MKYQKTGSTEIQPEANSKRLKARLFWSILSAAIILSTASHWLEYHYSYFVNSSQKKATGLNISRPLKYGSYGIYLASPPAEKTKQRRVVFLGNSVYQNCEIIERMQIQANTEGLGLALFNLAQTGAGIYDYLVQMPRALLFDPELIVISFTNMAFTPTYGNHSLPRFRTDSVQSSLDPSAVSVLRPSFYLRELGVETAVDALISTLYPFKRIDWLLRHNLDDIIASHAGPFPSWFRGAFPLPRLNLAQEWIDRTGSQPTKVPGQAVGYEETEMLVREVIETADRKDVSVLFIRQESGGPRFSSPDVMPVILRITGDYSQASVIDLMANYIPEEMPDGVHPMGAEARNLYAGRHYKAVVDTLNILSPLPAADINPAVREAEDFQRGTVDTDFSRYGEGIGVIVTKDSPGFVEYDFDVVNADRSYTFSVRYAAAAKRPLELIVNGEHAGFVATRKTGGWMPAYQQWEHTDITVKLKKNSNAIKLTRDGPFPAVDKISLLPNDQK